MVHVATLSGTGRLLVDGGDFDGIMYTITISRSECGSKRASGFMSGNAKGILKAAMNKGGMAKLILETGKPVDIVPTSSSLERALFSVSGPVPGF